jgi:ABC-type antimicrobial peptide transport system permease subunit
MGLSIGLACSMLIALWVIDELSFDKFIPNGNNIYQLWINATYDGKVNSQRSSPFPAYRELPQVSSKIKNTALADWGQMSLLSVGNNRVIKQSFHVTKEFLQVLQFAVLKGQPSNALEDPTSIVLTESTARALFGVKEPLGKLVRIDNDRDLKVTAVLKDLPTASSQQFDCLMHTSHLGDWVKKRETDWAYNAWQVFVALQPGANLLEVNNSIKDLLTTKGQVDLPREFFLYPLLQWHLYGDFENGKPVGGLIKYVRNFAITGVLIVVLACINFMNLATAKSEQRAKEVGVRKSIGSHRSDLIFQFLSESVLITTLAFMLALLMVLLVLPSFNDITKKHLFIDFTSPYFWVASLIFIVIIGFISGSYPAFYLSAFNPTRVLKGKIQIGKRAITPRKILVVFQFAFATFLIASTLVVYKQIQHAKKRDLGYEQENLITIQYTIDLEKNLKPLRQELEATGVVTSMTISSKDLTEINNQNFVDWEGKPKDQKFSFLTIGTELDFAKTMGVKIIQGRDFNSDADSLSVLINQAALDVMGLKEPLGAKFSFWDKSATIIGVTENIIVTPFRKPNPMFVIYSPLWANAVAVRFDKTNDLPTALKKVEAVFAKYNPAYPFEYSFVDDKFNRRYATINLTSTLASIFAGIALFITGFGLLGLAMFTAEQRTKEIGIRKVMGASIPSLVAIVAKEFFVLVLIAFVLSAPASWWVLAEFLKSYPYRIEFPWWAIAFSGIAVLAFALLVVGSQAWKAARANPVESLRSE